MNYLDLPLIIDIRYKSHVSGDVTGREASYRGVERSYYWVVRYT